MLDSTNQPAAPPGSGWLNRRAAFPATPGATPGFGPYDPGLGLEPGQDEAEEFADGDAVSPHATPVVGSVPSWGGSIFTAVILIILFLFFAVVVGQFSGAAVW